MTDKYRYIVAEELERELLRAKAELAAMPDAPAYRTKHQRYVVKHWPKRIEAARKAADVHHEMAKDWGIK